VIGIHAQNVSQASFEDAHSSPARRYRRADSRSLRSL
jgi:hypothetical protein